MSDKNTIVIGNPEELGRVNTRRSFLRMLGIGGSIVLLPSVFAACGDDDGAPFSPPGPGVGTGTGVRLDLSTDVGILNYAFALEQLEAAFYTAVVNGPAFSGLVAGEQEVLGDLYRHEVIHREFFRAAIPAASRIGDLAVNFGAAPNSRATILANAKAFEDLGVAAYNGAGKYLRSTDYLTLAGKIVSVEARHAAAIRDVLNPNGTAWGDVSDIANLGASNASGLDGALEPSAVLAAVAATGFVTTSVSIQTGPGTVA
jgi:hypothetical protein